MTRDEFESILEEAYNDGYNQAIEDIQEDILDEEAFDLEGEYDYYSESSKNVRKQMDKLKTTFGGDAVYHGGRADDDGTYHPNAINKGLDWINYTDPANRTGDNKYRVRRNSGESEYIGDEKSSPARGRIKVKNDNDAGAASSFNRLLLKRAIERNKKLVAARKDREIAARNLERSNKTGLFKNKGNKY